jgi:hemolysin-activating ACP:hemolysin acyltransferase
MPITVQKMATPWTALGLAAHFVARHDTFGRFPAADLIRTLSAQIHRGHYLFALDVSTDPARVLGYIGWALYDDAQAERFAATGVPPAQERADGGTVVWIMTAAADSREAFFALAKAGRALYPTHRIMGIRHKANGRRVGFDQSRARVRARKAAIGAD